MSMSTSRFGELRANLGLALLISALAASLLLNLQLGLNLFNAQPAQPPLSVVTVGASIGALPILEDSGTPSTLRLDDGRSTVLYVMAPHCPWCAKNLENMQALTAAASSNYRFLGVSNTATELPQYLASNPHPFPVYAVDAARLPRGFDPKVTPQLVLVGPDGIVEKVWLGALGTGGNVKGEVERAFGVKLPGFATASSF